MPEPRNVAWGYVVRDIGNGPELLVAERYKQDDPLRQGQLVMPGGGLKEGEGYAGAAIREVLEETGIRVSEDYVVLDFQPSEGEDCIIHYRAEMYGDVWLRYLDSGKEYFGRVVLLSPEDPYQEPVEQKQSDARNPRYMPLDDVYENLCDFTPACRVLLELLETA